MTLYRRPGHLVSPETIQQVKPPDVDTTASLSAGWGFEEQHEPTIAFQLKSDLRIAEVILKSMTATLEVFERKIRAVVPGPGRTLSQKTGMGLFAVLVFHDQVNAFLFDVTLLDKRDRRSYTIDESSIIGAPMKGLSTLA